MIEREPRDCETAGLQGLVSGSKARSTRGLASGTSPATRCPKHWFRCSPWKGRAGAWVRGAEGSSFL